MKIDKERISVVEAWAGRRRRHLSKSTPFKLEATEALFTVDTSIGWCGGFMWSTIATVLVCLVALVQIVIATVEMFLWSFPRVHSRLNFTDGEAKKVAPIVANAGLHNSFLAAGLIWGLLSESGENQIEVFFLTCVAIAGVFGAVTLKRTTLVLQTLPGALALVAVWMARF